MARLTVKEVLESKGKRKMTMIATSDHDTARACEEAGIDMICCSEVGLPLVRSGAPNLFIRPGLPISKIIASDEEAIRASYALMEQGADAVHIISNPHRVRAVARMCIPVCGHVGMVPAYQTWLGGFRAVGKTADEAIRIYDEVLAIQEAGAFAVEIEVVPERIAAEIAKRVEIFVIGIGSGSQCDCELLFAVDLLGRHKGHYPRHAKKYRNQYQDTVEAFNEFRRDVDSGSFPARNHSVAIEEAEFERFLETIDKSSHQ